MPDQPGQVEQAAPLGVAHGALEIRILYAGREVVLMHADDLGHQSLFMLLSLITLNQRSCSRAWKAANSSDVLARISMSIWSANFCATSGARAALRSSALMRSTIGRGVPA